MNNEISYMSFFFSFDFYFQIKQDQGYWEILDLFNYFGPFWTSLESFWTMLDHFWTRLFEPYFSYFFYFSKIFYFEPLKQKNSYGN